MKLNLHVEQLCHASRKSVKGQVEQIMVIEKAISIQSKKKERHVHLLQNLVCRVQRIKHC